MRSHFSMDAGRVACSLFCFVCVASAGAARGDSAVSTAGGPSPVVHGTLAPQFNRAQRGSEFRPQASERAQEEAERLDRSSAPPASAGALEQEIAVPGSTATEPQPLPPPVQPVDFALFMDRQLPVPAPAQSLSLVGEPAAAMHDQLLLVTGNWYAGMSTDGGETFGFMSPYRYPFPRQDDFCCDQQALYEPAHSALLWLQSSTRQASEIRINVDTGADGTFDCYYDFPAPAGEYLDFPDPVLTDTSLYLTANVYGNDTFAFDESIILRLSLNDVTTCSSISYDEYDAGDRFNFRATQGAHGTMYWGTHYADAQSTLRLYRWDEGASQVYYDDIPISAWNGGQAHCAGPDGKDWCGRLDDRILGAYVANGIIGFLWSAAEGGAYAYPYVQMARIRESDRTLIDEPQIYSNRGAYAYPSVSVNSRGDLGGTVVFGGGQFFPSCAAWVADDVSGGAPEVYMVRAGTSGPRDNWWGDFLTSRPHSPYSESWVGTCYTLQGGDDAGSAVAEVLWFGRQRSGPSAIVVGGPSPTATASATPQPSATPAATATPRGQRPGNRPRHRPLVPTSVAGCVCDCTGSHTVTISDVLKGVNIILGTARLDVCPACDAGSDGRMTVSELLLAVRSAVDGCPR